MMEVNNYFCGISTKYHRLLIRDEVIIFGPETYPTNTALVGAVDFLRAFLPINFHTFYNIQFTKYPQISLFFV